jgi:3-oxoadipate enol-lactonase
MTLHDVDATPVAWRESAPPQVNGANAEVALFLHGLGGSRTAWDPQLVDLTDAGYRCAAWDMPGYGCSPPPAGPLTFDVLADACATWMDAIGAASAHIVGLSLGGMVAQHVALRHPRRVRSLVLMDTSPAFGLDGTTSVASWLEQRLRPLRDGGTPATIAPHVLRGIMASDVADDALADAVAAMSRIPAAGLAAAVECLVTHDTLARLHEISVPTLVLVGEHDEETPAAYAARLADGIRGARLQQVAGAGHISNLEAPAAVNRLLREFLGGLPTAT